MSKIRLHGSSSGYTEIAPVAASGNNTLTLPNDGTIISKDSNGAVGVTSITVGTGVTIGDGRVTCTTLHGSAASLTQIPAANIVGVATAGLTKSGGGFGKILQVVPTVVNGAASVTISNTYANNSSYIYYLTSLNTTLTTTATNSKILISGNIFGEADQVDNTISFILSSTIGGTTAPIDTLRGPAYGDRSRITLMMGVGYYGNDQDSTPSVTSFSNFVYEPNQASGTAITIKIGVVNTSTTGTFYLNRSASDSNAADYEKGAGSLTLMEVES